jgi:RNAse (barnase) inhibitor barstar
MSGGWLDARALLPGLRGHRVHVVASADEAPLRAALASAGFAIFTLAGRGITSESTLFEEVARAFALGEDFGANWDALADALADLEEHAAPRLAVMWVDADVSLKADLQTFLSAVVALAAAADDLATADDADRAKQLEVFVLGAGAGFPGA